MGDSEDIPFYLRYLGGGDAPRHRGFSYNHLSPIEINKNGYTSYIGGDRDFISTAEMSYPLQGTNDGVRGVLFVDVGNVWGEGERAQFSDLRTAWGFGVRFPMAFPISLDFAWLVGPHDGEAASQVHFGIGQVSF
jgi:outer membrane protein insertion porin family